MVLISNEGKPCIGGRETSPIILGSNPNDPTTARLAIEKEGICVRQLDSKVIAI